jgi:MoaA/NifB/PqqE/SkfB family radical SAM enzyme
MCDSWRKPSKNELSLAEIEEVFEQLPRMDAVRLTGGEPFLRRDLPEITHLAQDKLRPLFLHITTNGFLSERIVRFCEERRKDIPLHLLVSVDGVGDKHDQVRGTKDAWNRVVATLESLSPRQKELRLRLAVNQTIIDAEGVEHYRLLREFLRPLGIRHNMVMAYDVSATYSMDAEVNAAPRAVGQFTTVGELASEQLEGLLREAEEDLADQPRTARLGRRYYLRGLRNRLLEGRGHPNPKCVALSSHMRLMPDGPVPTCQFNTFSVGKLPDQRFDEVWFGDRVNRQRAWVRRCPGCWAECEIIPNSIYTGDLIRESLVSPVHGLLSRWPAAVSNKGVSEGAICHG